MKAAIVEKAKAEKFVIQEKSIPEPSQNQVRVKVHACGVCHRLVVATSQICIKLPDSEF